MRPAFIVLPALALSVVACSSSDAKSDSDYEEQVVSGMHSALLADVDALRQAARDIQDSAPDPKGRGWDQSMDADAIDAMTKAWLRARGAYERTEGALAPLFPDTDAAIDARYDDFLTELGPDGDQNLFDDEGVTGMHAIERILFAKTIPAKVVAFEETLPGYRPAAWPATEEEAHAFKTELCAKLVRDTGNLADQWKPQKIDLPGAYTGLVDLMNEQREKVRKAASEEEESRYAQRTMADIRDNLTGTKKVYALFESWLATKPKGDDIADGVQKAFASLADTYDAVKGDAIPQPPESWSSENPTTDDLKTPFGVLFSAVQNAVDPNKQGSVVDGMTKTAEAVGIPVQAE
jgi:iron uptake system component EfeO